jgi:Aminoglycoside-2''-adenylyltransferase
MDQETELDQSGRVDAAAEAAQQRTMIAELAATLNASPVRYWLMGGWAVDAHIGRVTRQHSDIDFAVFLADRSALVDALGKHALVAAPGADPTGEFFDGGTCRVEITYLAQTETGEVVTPGFEHWPYLRGAFDGQVVIEGVVVPAMSVEALIDTKAHWQDHIGEPMRTQDRADLDALHALS